MTRTSAVAKGENVSPVSHMQATRSGAATGGNVLLHPVLHAAPKPLDGRISGGVGFRTCQFATVLQRQAMRYSVLCYFCLTPKRRPTVTDMCGKSCWASDNSNPSGWPIEDIIWIVEGFDKIHTSS